MISMAPEIYTVIQNNGDHKGPSFFKSDAKAWISEGYTVTIYTETGTATTVNEIDALDDLKQERRVKYANMAQQAKRRMQSKIGAKVQEFDACGALGYSS